LRGGEILLELHAADLLIARALGENETRAAHDPYAAHGEHSKAQAADRPHRRRDHAPKTAMHAHDWFNPRGATDALCAVKFGGQCGINKMARLTLSPIEAISAPKMMQKQPILMILCGIIPG
jgi:hypothetical protein